MKILMMTNTYTPHVGGVARSVDSFTRAFRKRGHRVLVVAPSFENQPHDEEDVVRVRAIQNFNGSDFSVALPFTGHLQSAVQAFAPDIVHSHHPFLIGAAAVRIAHLYDLPLVFTHHTRYEEYTHYAPGNSEALKRFINRLSTSYANLCEQVIAPSRGISRQLKERGVEAPIEVVPTGIDVERFQHGSGEGMRKALGIPEDAFVVGHVGRLASEKNLRFLADAVAAFLTERRDAYFLLVGSGPSENELRAVFRAAGVERRLVMTGALDHPLLASAYQAMDVFAFASQTETQGLVLTEAMAASLPVIALSGPGADDVVEDMVNGRLLPADATANDFAAALATSAGLSEHDRESRRAAAFKTAERFALSTCADKALGLYANLAGEHHAPRPHAYNVWTTAQRLIEAEWDVLKGMAEAAGAAIRSGPREKATH